MFSMVYSLDFMFNLGDVYNDAYNMNCYIQLLNFRCPETSRFAILRLFLLISTGFRHRISFKIATIAFKVLHFQQPSYLAALVPRYVPTRSLRSSSSLSICIPSRKNRNGMVQVVFIRCLGHLELGYHVIFYPFPLFLFSEKD